MFVAILGLTLRDRALVPCPAVSCESACCIAHFVLRHQVGGCFMMLPSSGNFFWTVVASMLGFNCVLNSPGRNGLNTRSKLRHNFLFVVH